MHEPPRERVVTRLVTVGIVVGLEPVNIHEQQRKRAACPTAPTPLLVKNFAKGTAIVQACQAVGSRQQLQFRFCTYPAA